VHGYATAGAVAGPFGAASASSRTRVTVGPGGGFHAVNTKNVTRVDSTGTATAEARRVAYGTSSGTRASGTAYFKATSAEGRSYTYVDRTGLTGDPYGTFHAHQASVETAGPLGVSGARTVQASRVTVGTGDVQARSAKYVRATSTNGAYTRVEGASVTAGPYGAVRAHEVHSVEATPLGTTSASRSVTVARGGATGAVAVSHSTTYVGVRTLETRATYVRESYTSNTFTPGWYQVHTAAWQPARWRVASIWVAPPWQSLARFCAVSTPAVQYDYGSTAVIEKGQVYLEGEQVASVAEYADQAQAVADSGRKAEPDEEEEWQPLGVFGLIRGQEQEPQAVVQLAVNKDGVLRGNYHDALTDSDLPVYGAVDRKTQRVAWSVGNKKTVVMEAGLRNLTMEQTTALVHYGTTRTRQLTLVRLEQPRDEQRPRDEPPDEDR
jgi:hypothetical protein